MLSHSNSFGNDAEKDTAGCCALTRKYIVIGEKKMTVLEVNVRPMPSHSNSFGNNVEKDTAGCRALDRKYIVIGTKNDEF